MRSSVEPDGETRKRGLEEQPSFFDWFSADNVSDEPGEIIRDDIWPNPLQFYLVKHSVHCRFCLFCLFTLCPSNVSILSVCISISVTEDT